MSLIKISVPAAVLHSSLLRVLRHRLPPARPAEGPSQGHVGRPVGADQVSDAMATDFTSGLRYGAGLAVGAQNWRSTMILWKQNVSMTGCRAAASAIDDVVK